jgi:hypothetical protein
MNYQLLPSIPTRLSCVYVKTSGNFLNHPRVMFRTESDPLWVSRAPTVLESKADFTLVSHLTSWEEWGNWQLSSWTIRAQAGTKSNMVNTSSGLSISLHKANPLNQENTSKKHWPPISQQSISAQRSSIRLHKNLHCAARTHLFHLGLCPLVIYYTQRPGQWGRGYISIRISEACSPTENEFYRKSIAIQVMGHCTSKLL